ncbi:hypothetical protein C0J52_10433 [Blattella germanica]|nr:hypothetical protein C0J52_10433 [Blattella germanica]
MSFIQVVALFAFAVGALTAPVEEAQSYSSISSGPLASHGSYEVAHEPIAIAHAPVIVAAHAPVEVHHEPHVEHYEHHAPAHYEFKYGVHDGHTHDIKEQAEKRVGDKVEGYYKLVEPDGTTRTVHYTADKHTGFHAQVVKSGHATHPIEAPVHKVVTPVISYAHAAPVISYSHAPTVSYSAPSHGHSEGGATSYSSSNIGFVVLSTLLAGALAGFNNAGYGNYAPGSAALNYAHGPASGHGYASGPVDYYAPPNYEFNYGVKDGHTNDIKEQKEKRVGDKVDGHYSVVEPDGTTRTVHYTADDQNGFNAVVSRDGKATHPLTPAKSYGAVTAPGYASPAYAGAGLHSAKYSHSGFAPSYAQGIAHGASYTPAAGSYYSGAHGAGAYGAGAYGAGAYAAGAYGGAATSYSNSVTHSYGGVPVRADAGYANNGFGHGYGAKNGFAGPGYGGYAGAGYAKGGFGHGYAKNGNGYGNYQW